MNVTAGAGRPLVFLLILALTQATTACHQRTNVVPRFPAAEGKGAQRPMSIALFIDSSIDSYRHEERTNVDGLGLWTLDVDMDVGKALGSLIEQTATSHFRKVQRVKTRTCPDGAEGLIAVSFAREPSISTTWSTGMWTDGGVTTAELTCLVVARTCDGKDASKKIVVGYGSVKHMEWWNWPNQDDFQPGIDAAMTDFASHLGPALDALQFTARGGRGSSWHAARRSW